MKLVPKQTHREQKMLQTHLAKTLLKTGGGKYPQGHVRSGAPEITLTIDPESQLNITCWNEIEIRQHMDLFRNWNMLHSERRWTGYAYRTTTPLKVQGNLETCLESLVQHYTSLQILEMKLLSIMDSLCFAIASLERISTSFHPWYAEGEL